MRGLVQVGLLREALVLPACEQRPAAGTMPVAAVHVLVVVPCVTYNHELATREWKRKTFTKSIHGLVSTLAIANYARIRPQPPLHLLLDLPQIRITQHHLSVDNAVLACGLRLLVLAREELLHVLKSHGRRGIARTALPMVLEPVRLLVRLGTVQTRAPEGLGGEQRRCKPR